jgi:hypothetical protein
MRYPAVWLSLEVLTVAEEVAAGELVVEETD